MKSLVYAPVFAILIFTLSAFTIQDAYAATAVTSGNWNDPATWGGAVPGENDPKTIPVGITVTIPAGDIIDNNGTIDNSGFLDIYGTLNNKSSGIVNNFGDIVVNPGGIIDNKPSGLVVNQNLIDNSGIIDNSGTINNFSTLANSGTINNNSGGTMENFGFMENFGLIENSGAFNQSGGVFNNGTFNNNCGAIYTGPPLSPNPANNTCVASDLFVNKTGPPTITAGSIIHYDIRVNNTGTEVATNVTVTDTIPIEIVGLSLTGASPQCGPIQLGQIQCAVGNMNPDSFFDIFIELQIPPAAPGGFIINNATASSLIPDISPANNTDTHSTLVLSSGPMISITDANVTEGNLGTSTAIFTVSLSSISSQTVSVNFATQDISAKTTDNDYVGTLGMLTFAPGQTSKSINATINGDTEDEPNETFYVNLSNPVNAAFGDNQGIGIILNDDLDPFVLFPVNMGGVGTIVNLSGFDFDPGSTVSINFDGNLLTTTTAIDGDFINYPITIPPATAGPHTITSTDGAYMFSSVFNVVAPRLTATDTISSNNIVASASPGTTLNLYMKGFAANDPLKMITVSLDGIPVGSPVSPNKVGSYKAFPLTLPLTPASQYLISATDGTNTKSIILVGSP